MSLSPHPIETALKTLAAKAENSIEQTTTLEDLEQLRVNYLGKKGELSQILREMGKLTPEERPRLGAIANEVKESVQSLLESQRESLQNAQIKAKLAAETLDVTLPALSRPLGRIHPLNSTVDRMIDIFVGLGYSIATGPQVETDYYNFEALNIPADHPARDMQDTFFLRDGFIADPYLPGADSLHGKSRTPDSDCGPGPGLSSRYRGCNPFRGFPSSGIISGRPGINLYGFERNN